MDKLAIAFDLDNTLCIPIRKECPEDILKVEPKKVRGKTNYYIDIIKELKEEGVYIIIFTRRGVLKNGRRLTKKWLKKYNVPYDKLITEKPHYDLLVDDKVFSAHNLGVTADVLLRKIAYAKNEVKRSLYKPREIT